MKLKNTLSGAIAAWIAGFLVLVFGGAVSAAPAKVMNLQALGTGPTTVQLTWTAPTTTAPPLLQNDIRYATGSTAISTLTWANGNLVKVVPGVPAPTASGTVQNMTVTGLTSSTTYKFAMKVSDASGWSVISVEAVTGTSPAPPPADRSVSLAWDPVTDWSTSIGGKGYELFWSEVNGSWVSSPTTSKTVPDPTVATVITNLKRGTTYYFVVKAFADFSTGQAKSDDSNIVTWTSPP